MTCPTVLITGAFGNVGAEIVQSLKASGIPLRAAVRNVERARERFGGSLEAVAFDFVRPDTFGATFEGIDAMFLVRPPQLTNIAREMIPALEAARSAGVKHVVFLSLIGIEKATYVPHFQVETWLRRSGLTWTFLRCSFFMQNLNTTHRQEIRERSELFVPVGRARTSFIDVRDVAAVAVRALIEPTHARQAYDLTGGEALEYGQVAAILTEVLGRPITYRDPSLLRFVLTHFRRGTPLPMAVVMAGLYLSTRYGMADKVTREVERLIGRRPIPFRHYAQDYRASWT